MCLSSLMRELPPIAMTMVFIILYPMCTNNIHGHKFFPVNCWLSASAKGGSPVAIYPQFCGREFTATNYTPITYETQCDTTFRPMARQVCAFAWLTKQRVKLVFYWLASSRIHDTLFAYRVASLGTSSRVMGYLGMKKTATFFVAFALFVVANKAHGLTFTATKASNNPGQTNMASA